MQDSLPDSSRHVASTLRIGAFGSGVVCWNAATRLWEGGSCSASSLSLALMLCCYLVAFAAFLVAIIGDLPERARWTLPLALTIAALCYAQHQAVARAEHGVLTTDVQMFMDQAARLLRHGENPYAHDLLDAYRLNRSPFNFSTPLLDADLTGRVAYPALSFLLFVPFQWLGISAGWVYPLVLVLALVLLYAWSPRVAQPLVLLPFFIDPHHLLYTLGGVSDAVWGLLLILMLRHWDRPRARGIWYGLACAFKQQPWLLAPFLLLRLWHESGGSRAERLRVLTIFTLFAVGAFVAVNLPFFVWSPSAWLAGILEPLVRPMITFGQGLSALTMLGRVVLPKGFYSLFSLLALGLALFAYHRHYPRTRLLLWLAPGFALWLSNRSLTSYWYFYLLPLVFDLATSRPPDAPCRREQTPSWRPTLLAAGGCLALLALLVVWSAVGKAPLSLRLVLPLETAGVNVERITLAVRNDGERPLEPRFSVQVSALQPFFWLIEAGPRFLAPRQEATYTISTSMPYAVFEVRRGARVTVADAHTYHRRATIQVYPRRDYVYPDVVPNGTFSFWQRDGSAPAFWGRVVEPARGGTLAYLPVQLGAERSGGVRFELAAAPKTAAPSNEAASVALDTYLMLPESPITLWVELPRGANRWPDPELLYGLRLIIDEQALLVLFGDRAAQGKLGPLPYVLLPAPRGKWSRHAIDLRRVLRTLGLRSLPRRHRMPRFEHLDFPMTAVNLQLLLARRRGTAPVSASFGPLLVPPESPSPEQLHRGTRRDQAALALWKAQYLFSVRNYAKARQSAAEATALAPDVAFSRLQLGEAEFWLGRWRAAAAALEKALGSPLTKGLAYKGLGWCHYNLGETEEALLAWSAAEHTFSERNRPEDKLHLADALKGMALVLLRQGRCRLAAEKLQRLRALAPELTLPAETLRLCPAPTN